MMEFRKYRSYPEYKESKIEWIMKIPVKWDKMKLKRVFRICNGSTPESSVDEYWNGNILWATPDDLGQIEGPILYETKKTITEEGYHSCGTTLIPKNNLILSIRAPIGHLAITGNDICINQGCKGLIFKDNDEVLKYFYFLILVLKEEFESWGQGSTFKELSRKHLQKIRLIRPSINEQHQIASFLDHKTSKIDQLIQEKQELIELLKKKKTTLITKCVTKGLDDIVEMKDSGIEWIGEVPKHWEVKRFKYMLKEPLRYGANESGFPEEETNEVRLIRISDINKENEIKNEDKKFLPKEIAKPYLLSKGDLLFARSGATVGKSYLYEDDSFRACFAGYFIKATISKSVGNYKFVNYYTKSNSYWGFINSIFIQATIQNVSAEKYKNFFMPIPPITEQNEIVLFLDKITSKIDQSIQEIQESIAFLQKYRTSLITHAVTGKIDVRGWNREETDHQEAAYG